MSNTTTIGRISITFKAWFIVRGDGRIDMIDTCPAEMVDGDEQWFGSYNITIPTPPALRQRLDEIHGTIQGRLTDPDGNGGGPDRDNPAR